jgi:ubiquinol-cytochrome c reductase cytochrome c1 subunit
MKKFLTFAPGIFGVFLVASCLIFLFHKKENLQETEPKHVAWPFNGAWGTVDKPAAQRGFQVYKEVCSACHSMDLVAFRKLTDLGFSQAEVKALAATYNYDDLDDSGQPKTRPGRPSDYFKAPFPNEKAARASNGGALPPDLSLITKAREHGPDYVYSILTGFSDAPADVKMAPGKYYNAYFPGRQISMPPPLADNRVTYEDGTRATVDQMAKDVVVFLQWAAEPEMENRKETGIKVIAFLLVMTGFFFVAYRRIWKDVH